MKHVARVFSFLLVFLWMASAALARQNPFAPGEVLHYSVRWGVLPVALVRLEVMPMTRIAGEPAYHFSFRIQTLPAVEVLYPVAGGIDAFTDLSVSRSLRLEKNMRQGRRPKIFRVDFDWAGNTATFVNEEGTRRRMKLEEGTLDILSILYHARTLTLAEGTEVRRRLNDGRKHLAARARVVERGLVQVGESPWPAIHVVPEIRKRGGVLAGSPESPLHLWFSDDDRRLPLKLTGVTRVGRFTVELAPEPAGPASESGLPDGRHAPSPTETGPPKGRTRADAS